jgi:hypothetical protein
MISRRVEGDVVEAKTQGEENEIIINHLGVQGNGCQGEMRNLVEYELTDNRRLAVLSAAVPPIRELRLALRPTLGSRYSVHKFSCDKRPRLLERNYWLGLIEH